MATPATPITFTLENKTTDQIAIRSITYVDNSNIAHSADYSNFAYGGTNNTGTTTLITYDKQYVTGDYLERLFDSDTHDRIVYYSTHTGTQLNIQNVPNYLTTGIGAGWSANSDDGAYDGTQYVVSITSATQIIMSASPLIPNPVVGGTITFSSSTNKIVISDTTGIYAGWEIRNNGYNTPGTVVSVENSQTLIVDILPTNPEQGNSMLFTTSTNYLTVNNTNNIQAGYTASSTDNAYDDSQYVLLVVDSNTLQMSAQPNSAPSTSPPANKITFTSDQYLVTISSGTSTTFIVNYTNNNSTPAVNYQSTLTVNAKNLGNNSNIVGFINNFVSINLPPPPPPTYTGRLEGGGGGGARGGSGGGSTAGASVGHRGLSDGNQSIGAPNGFGGGSTGGSGKVVCTAMNDYYGFGSFRNRVWLAYAKKNLTKAHEVGYHTIFLPLVNYGFNQGNNISHRVVRKVLEHIARHRSTDIRAEMRGLKRDNIGRIYRFILEPLCYIVGKIKGY